MTEQFEYMIILSHFFSANVNSYISLLIFGLAWLAFENPLHLLNLFKKYPFKVPSSTWSK